MGAGAAMAQGWQRAALEAQALPPGVDWLPAPGRTLSRSACPICGCWEVKYCTARSAVSAVKGQTAGPCVQHQILTALSDRHASKAESAAHECTCMHEDVLAP